MKTAIEWIKHVFTAPRCQNSDCFRILKSEAQRKFGYCSEECANNSLADQAIRM